MPEHTTFLTYLLAKFPALRENADNIGYSFIVGYLALPVGIVASQLLGLQPDFEEP